MSTVTFADKAYEVDADGFLLDFSQWDENFARSMAPRAGIISGLSDDHWKVIRFVRDYFKTSGKCPLVPDQSL